MPKGPKIYDGNLKQQIGLPKNKYDNFISTLTPFKDKVRQQLRVLDEQDAITRYRWWNVPNMDSQQIERLLYYYGQLVFFYYEPLDTFYMLPFANEGMLDFYGRFTTVRPLPITTGKDDKAAKAQEALLSQYKLRIYYELPDEPLSYDELIHAAVIVRDYTPQRGTNEITSRQVLNEPLLELMAENLPLLHTHLTLNCGIAGLRINNNDEAQSVYDANLAIANAALNGQKWIPIQGSLDFQDLSATGSGDAQDYLIAMQAEDNYRKSLYGLSAGALYDKSSYVNESQVQQPGSTSPLTDGLYNRQLACLIFNAIFPIGMSCEISETASQVDKSGDGLADDSNTNNGVSNGMEETNNEHANV